MRIISFIVCTLFCYSMYSQADFKPMVHTSGSKSLNYQILEPPGFDEGKKYPLFIFLHGAGERGSDNKKQLVHGSQLFRDSISKYPAVVIFPQCPKDDYWAKLSRPDKGGRDRFFEFESSGEPKASLGMVIELITEMKSKPYIDTDRIYISGLSMGGFGVFELMWRMPETFAAAAPICGGGDRNMTDKMTTVPFWIFHGKDDSVVHPNLSARMLKGIQYHGGKAKISMYPGVDHNSWDNAFAEPDFLSWIFSKTKTK